MNQRILAKGVSKERPVPAYATMAGHAAHVADAGDKLARWLGRGALQHLGLVGRESDLRTVLRWFGWTHDWGKAGNQYQQMLHGGNPLQLMRHEVVSALMLCHHPVLCRLTETLGEELVNVLLCTVLGHHRKFPAPFGSHDIREREELIVNINHPDFGDLLSTMCRELGVSEPSDRLESFTIIKSYVAQGQTEFWRADDKLRRLKDGLIDWSEESNSDEQIRFTALCKAFAITADVAGSALPEPDKRTHSIRSASETGITSDDMKELIERWAKNREIPTPFRPREFQRRVAESEFRLTLVEAGCGSGKSVAAYMWAQRWAERFKADGLSPPHFFFCMPTMGTATEQFRDYAMEADVDAVLEHSKAGLDLDSMREALTLEEDESIKEQFFRQQETIDAFRLWTAPMTVCTADTVLGSMVNARKSLYHFPVVANGIIVFDEIHAMDNRMFRHLLAFLRYLPNLPVLLMTASLSERRKKMLMEARREPMSVISDRESRQAEVPRYLLHRIEDTAALNESIAQTVRAGGNVLWVCNQVERAGETYSCMHKRFEQEGVRVFVYHSRFRYGDRSKLHRRVVDSFKDGKGPVILIATQVAEMSLDLSADLLVTDLAPIPALIQRLGRLNRHALPDGPKPAYIMEPDGSLPYEPKELELTEEWMAALQAEGRPLSQLDLAQYFERLDSGAEQNPRKEWREAFNDAVFFSGIWETPVSPLRESGQTVSIILDNDLKSFQAEHGEGPGSDWVGKYEVPILLKNEVFGWKRIAGRPVAPADRIKYDYDELTGRGIGAKWVD